MSLSNKDKNGNPRGWRTHERAQELANKAEFFLNRRDHGTLNKNRKQIFVTADFTTPISSAEEMKGTDAPVIGYGKRRHCISCRKTTRQQLKFTYVTNFVGDRVFSRFPLCAACAKEVAEKSAALEREEQAEFLKNNRSVFDVTRGGEEQERPAEVLLLPV